MARNMNRRAFVGTLPLWPLAKEALIGGGEPSRLSTEDLVAARMAEATQAAPSFPIIDTHIHIYDKTKPGGAPWPRDVPGGGEPPQGMVALPNRYKAIVAPFGVAGAIIVEASPRLEDNQWCLDVAANHPIIVGLVGRLDPGRRGVSLEFGAARQEPAVPWRPAGPARISALDSPTAIGNLRRLADADCSLDVDTPRQGMTAAEVLLKVLDKVPNVRLVMDHLPDVRFPDDAAKERYVRHLRELTKRPNVYIKLSEVVRRYEGRVSTDLHLYRAWLDELWDIFGEDRIIFGSDWPQSETLEFNSYPNVFGVARAYVMSKSPAAMEKVFWTQLEKAVPVGPARALAASTLTRTRPAPRPS